VRSPDITTPEGRDAVERAVLEAMGYRFTRIPETGYPVYERNGQRVPMGWLYTGDGMVEVKRWFAQRGIIVSSQPATMQHGTAFAEAFWTDDMLWVEGPDEPTTVALALYRALEEQKAYEQGRRAERERIVRLLRDQIKETPVGQYATSALSEAIRRIEEDHG